MCRADRPELVRAAPLRMLHFVAVIASARCVFNTAPSTSSYWPAS